MACICPNCGSRNVEPDTSASTAEMGTGSWKCQSCGYKGVMPEE
ncbi:MAG: hypothetical protein ABEJ93_01825 [Candidatus Nanohalobium sp.]